MKQKILLIIIITLGCIFILLKSCEFQKTEEQLFNTTQQRLDSLQKNILLSQKNIKFCKRHKKEMLLLSQKGWIRPQKRVKVGEFLDKLKPSFQRLTYQCNPEEIKTLINRLFRVTLVTIETSSFQDKIVYKSLETLFMNFPGVLIARELILKRSTEHPSYIIGNLSFEWVSMKRQENDK